MINPFKLISIYRKAATLFGLLEDAQMKKSLFKSKTFWFNLLSAAAALSGVATDFVSPQILAAITGVINVGLRLVTSEPVSVT